jgi:hypothetical protein
MPDLEQKTSQVEKEEEQDKKSGQKVTVEKPTLPLIMSW